MEGWKEEGGEEEGEEGGGGGREGREDRAPILSFSPGCGL